MGRLLKVVTVLFFTMSCAQSQHVAKIANIQEVLSSEALHTVSTAVSPSTTIQKASRSTVRSALKLKQNPVRATYASAMPDDFWWRLSHNCECSGGDGCAYSGGWFQFKGSTARSVGYFPEATYEQQLAMAKWWLLQIYGMGGTMSGWPICWWRAME